MYEGRCLVYKEGLQAGKYVTAILAEGEHRFRKMLA